MHNVVVIITLLFSCSGMKKIQSSEPPISITLDQVGEADSYAYRDLTFTITNRSNKFIFIPEPLNQQDAFYSQFPECFEIKLDGLSCDQPIDVPRPKGKNISNFIKLAPNNSRTFKVNPAKVQSLFCEPDGEGKPNVQIAYMPPFDKSDEVLIEKFYKNHPQKDSIIEIFKRIPRDTIFSNTMELKIK